MPVWIQQIETMNPGKIYTQEDISAKMLGWMDDERGKRIIRALYQKSGIDTRYSVIHSFDQGLPGDFFPLELDGRRREPSTAERNALYTRESHRLAVELAHQAISNCPIIDKNDITHVITVSCTGFCNPGPDYHIVNELGLSQATQRYNLGFMGCYAALPGLHMAQQFCEARADAVVLVLSLELCSLHLQLDGTEDTMLANSLFADGAAAAIVSARPPLADQNCYRLDAFHSSLITSGKGDMAWTIGDRGFDIALSSYVPKIIGANIQSAIMPLLATRNFSLADIQTWAIHPGGRAIVDKVAKSLALNEVQVSASRKILSKFGNMSSATILFVLQEILNHPEAPGQEEVCAMAFGPGLTVEMALLQARRPDRQS